MRKLTVALLVLGACQDQPLQTVPTDPDPTESPGDDDDDDTTPTPTTETTPTTSTSTTDVDTDGDGLTDAEEAALGTNPTLADSDGDGWDDGVEVDGHTDPTSASDHPYTGGWAIGACRDDIVATGTQVGDIAEDFVLVDQFGENLRLHDFCDRQVLLVSAAFW
jgi:hypothetical protein